MVVESVTGRPYRLPDHIPSGRRAIFISGPVTTQSSKVARRGDWGRESSAHATSPEGPAFCPGLPAGTGDMGTGTVTWWAASMLAQPVAASTSAARSELFIRPRYGGEGPGGQPGGRATPEVERNAS